MRRLRRPSPALAVAFLALVVALGGTALAATGQLVNIADGSHASQIAHVTSGGRLEVGDGSGPLTVDGPDPHSLIDVRGANGGLACQPIGAPPAGKAWILTSARINLYAASGFSANQFIALYDNATCGGSSIADYTPTALGAEPVDFGEGVVIPPGGALAAAAFNNSSFNYEVFASGHQVSGSSVAAPRPSRVTVPKHGPPAGVRR